MPSIILTDLAPELLIHILKSADNFADVTSLSSISRKMFIVWKTNIDVICNAILERTVPCFAQARELVETQEKAEGDEHVVFGYQSAIDRVQWMLKEADTAAKVFVHFQSDAYVIFSAYDRALVKQKTLRIDFIKAYYRATTLATLGTDSIPLRLLLSWDALDCERVWDVNTWLLDFYGPSLLKELGVWMEWNDRNPIPTGKTNSESLAEISKFLKALILALDKVAAKPGSRMLFSGLIGCGHYPAESATNRGAHLADLLPLLCENDAPFCIGHKLSEAVLQLRHP